MSPIRRTFGDKDELALALADAVAGNLKAGIAARGHAALAVSGGSTPARFFKALGSRADIDWVPPSVICTSTRRPPANRAVPLIHSILFFLNRNSTPFVRPVTMRSLRVWTWFMSIATGTCPALVEGA